MLNVVTSKSIYKIRDAVLIKMRDNLKSGREQLIIVPDRFSMSAESEVLEDMGIKGSFDITVTSFMKLAKRVLGAKARDSMTREGAVMLLSRVISKCRDQLGVYKKASYKSGFATELYAVIASIRKNCYSVEDLKAVLPKLPEYVGKKCVDIVTVYEEYVKELSYGRMDGSTLLEDLTEAIPDSDFIACSDVYLMDFFSYTKEQKRVIKQLILRAGSVTIPRVRGRGENARIYDTRYADEFITYATKKGVKVIEVEVEDGLSGGREIVVDRLFSYSRGERVKGGAGIKIYEAESVEGEVEHLARTILQLTKEGFRYKDVSVLAGDVEGITPIIKRIFKAHQIPVFTDDKTLLKSTPVSQFLLLTSRLGTKIETGEGIALLKNAYSGADNADTIALQNHCARYNVERLRVDKPIPLGKDYPTYEGAERARERIKALLLKIPKEGTAEEYATLLESHLDGQKARIVAEVEARKMENRGDHVEASKERQSVTKLYGVLDQIKRLMTDAILTSEEFDGVLNSALETVGISYAPTYVDTVYVGGAEKSRFCDCKVFYIIGAQGGSLPLSTKRMGIIGETEERALKKLDVDLYPSAKEASMEEMLHLTQLLIMEKERMYISYTPSKGRSEIVDELDAIFSDLTKNTPYDLYSTDEEWLSYYAPTRQAGLYSYTHRSFEKYRQALKRALSQEEEGEKSWEISCGRELFFPKNTTSVSQLGAYFTCPYKHFVEYGLRARPIVKASSPMIAGNFLHEVFEKGVKALSEKSFPDTDTREYENIVKAVIEEVKNGDAFAMFKNEGWAVTLKRLVDEGERALKSLVKRIKNSKYKPSEYEYSFGFTNPYLLKGETVTLTLVGKIDRIDRLGDKAILLDYKTGSSHGSIKDLYYGVGIQLALYMKALENTGAESVGAFYYPIQDGYTEGKRAKLCGNIETIELKSFDTTWDYGKSSDYVEVDYDKKDKAKSSTEDTLLSKAELQAVKDYSEKVSKKAIDEICSGYVAPTPLGEEKCDWCNLRPLCKGRVVPRSARSVHKDALKGGEEDDKLD